MVAFPPYLHTTITLISLPDRKQLIIGEVTRSDSHYFTDIGNQCADSIGPSSKQFNEYLIGNCTKSVFLHPTDKRDIVRIINELKPKNSRGHDGISSKLVKDLKNDIALPLSIMINTSIECGYVPETMKLAKVIPIYIYQRISKC